jgi:hypothetical protein
MLGKIIVTFMNWILNAVAVLIIIAGAILGGMIASSMYESVFWGVILGLLVGFIITVVFLGIAFLVLEIHNNIAAIAMKILEEQPEEK